MGIVTRAVASHLLQLRWFAFLHHHTSNLRILAAHAAREARSDGDDVPTTSCLCTQRRATGRGYVRWCARLGEAPRFHRKQWEHVTIGRALEERGLLAPGRRGLGFAVGTEPVVAAFAAMDCDVMATDIGAETEQARRWKRQGDFADGLGGLNTRRLCDPAQFASRVTYRTVDMRDIPADLAGFDFCWSSCALQHLGSIEAGFGFIERSLETLRPGGVAVHTMQFNLSPERGSRERAATVFYARRHIDAFADRLERGGHRVAPIDWGEGDDVLDAYVDLPPYAREPHLKLLTAGFVTTSFCLIVVR